MNFPFFTKILNNFIFISISCSNNNFLNFLDNLSLEMINFNMETFCIGSKTLPGSLLDDIRASMVAQIFNLDFILLWIICIMIRIKKLITKFYFFWNDIFKIHSFFLEPFAYPNYFLKYLKLFF